jgi:hypothetical protein
MNPFLRSLRDILGMSFEGIAVLFSNLPLHRFCESENRGARTIKMVNILDIVIPFINIILQIKY